MRGSEVEHLPPTRTAARTYGLSVLVLVSIIGATFTLVSIGPDSATAAGWTAVAAGVVLLAFAAVGPSLSHSTAVDTVQPA